MNCPKCGNEAGESKFCPECGFDMTNGIQTESEVNEKDISKKENSGVDYYEALKKVEEEKQKKEKTKSKKKAIGCAIPLVILILLIAVIFGAPIIAEKQKRSKPDAVNIIKSVMTLSRNKEDLEMTDLYVKVENVGEKSIESLEFTFAVYNDEEIEKATITYPVSAIIKPHETFEGAENGGLYNFLRYFSNIFIDTQSTADIWSIKIKEIKVKFSDETEQIQECNLPVSEIYFHGMIDNVFYYVERNDAGRIVEQKKIDADTDNLKSLTDDELGDEMYYDKFVRAW